MRSARTFRRAILVAAGLVVVCYLAGITAVVRYGPAPIDLGWNARHTGHGVFVSTVTPGGPAEGRLEPGDRLLGIDGYPMGGYLARGSFQRVIVRTSDYTLRVDRAGKAVEVPLRSRSLPSPDLLKTPLLLIPVGLVFLAFALTVGLLRPAEPVARLAAVFGLLQSLSLLGTIYYLTSNTLTGLEQVPYFLTQAAFPWNLVAAYHLYYRFPPTVNLGRLWSAILLLLIVAAVVVSGMTLSSMMYIFGALPLPAGPVQPYAHQFTMLSGLAMSAGTRTISFMPVVIAAMMVQKYRRAGLIEERRRLRWILLGSLAGVLPMAIFPFVLWVGYGELLDLYTYTLSNLFLVAIPVSFAYVILKHRLFDIQVVVRRGIQYLLARNALRLFLAIPVLVLVTTALAHPERNLSEQLRSSPLNPIWIGAALLSLRYRPQLTAWIDRKFFRESYDREQLLVQLNQQVGAFETLDSLAAQVCGKLDAALHLSSIHVFLRDFETLQLSRVHALGSQDEAPVIPDRFRWIQKLEPAGAYVSLDPAVLLDLHPEERQWLEQRDVNLVIPVHDPVQQLIGVVLLGPKRSEEPFSQSERQLLQILAARMAMAWENARLRMQVRREAGIRQEVLARIDAQGAGVLRECPTCGTCYDSGDEVCSIDRFPLTFTLPVDRVIDAKYRLDRRLGTGGMGAVFEAFDLRLERPVALKFMMGERLRDPVAQRRFEREARAAGRLQHPNVVSIFDFGRSGSSAAWIAMELARGPTLRQKLLQVHALPPPVIADVFECVFQGVGAAHRAGIIHRDLKPENVVLAAGEDPAAMVKVLDFGLARMLGPDDAADTLTLPGTIMGTRGYMSLEQLRGEALDERADIFALGVMVFETLTGTRPFVGEAWAAEIYLIEHNIFRLPSTGPELEALEAVFRRCLAARREERFASIDALREALMPALRSCPPIVPSTPALVEPTMPPESLFQMDK